MIELNNLTKRYGSKVAVDGLNLTVNDGEILGFLGPNGAGKSTTMNMITGYISATEGSVKVDGYDVLASPMEVKKRIGYLPEQPPLYMDMTVEEYLSFAYDLKKVKLDKERHLKDTMKLVKLEDVKGRKIKNLSKGYKQRVGLAQALLGNPEVLILDEPTVGLDPKQIIEIRNLIKTLGKNHTIILSSHIMQEISAVCERVVIINKGKFVAEDTPEALASSMSGGNSLTIEAVGDAETVKNAVTAIPDVVAVRMDTKQPENAVRLLIDAQSDIREALFRAFQTADIPLILIQPNQMSLEEIFLQLTKEETRGERRRREKEEQKAEEELTDDSNL